MDAVAQLNHQVKSVGDDCHRMKFVGKKIMNNEFQFFL